MESTEAKSTIELTLEILSGILVPLSIAFVGIWYTWRKDRSDKKKQEAETFSTFLDALSCDNPNKQKYALIALHHLKKEGGFPTSLLDNIDIIASSSNLEVAAAAQLVELNQVRKEDIPLLQELLLPVKIHLDRTRNAFDVWISSHNQKPNETIEEKILSSNRFIRDLLVEKWYLIPTELRKDALMLIDHYNDWISEYFRVRPEGRRLEQPKFIFVGSFPSSAESNFINLYNEKTKSRK